MSVDKKDVISIISKGVLGAMPFIGPLAAEIVGAIIPNQRIERIESLLEQIENKLTKEDQQRLKQTIALPESIDLIEEGFLQASRSLSTTRREYIASLLKNSLCEDQIKYIENKRLLILLGQLNDIEILILRSYSLRKGDPAFNSFWETHKKTLSPPPAHTGSTQEEVDRYTIFQTHKMNLNNMGLLRANFKKPKKGEFPEFDSNTGKIKANGYSLTPLARMLLQKIDLPDS